MIEEPLIGEIKDLICIMTDCDELGTEVMIISTVGTCGEISVTKPICTMHARMLLHTLDGLHMEVSE